MSSKPDKSPGLDGFTHKYYQLFLPPLGRQMIRTFNALGHETVFPPEALKAHISLIPKKDKDPSACGSYHPISLLNVDVKLFTKILATRIQPHLTALIHLDQVGFIPTPEARDNTEKAFDCVNWSFMFYESYDMWAWGRGWWDGF